jgi:2-haloacid dehalogenase
MYSAIVFDVNETLLDLKAMDSAFDTHFGPGSFRKEWFGEVLKLAFVTTITGRYSDFGLIGKSALEILESRHQRPSTDTQRANLLALMRELPAHPDVPSGLETLRSEGFRLVALTNSTASTAEAQLTHAGIRHFFEFVFSADSVKRLKPALEPYQMVAGGLGVAPSSLLMVAAHSWDIAGAMRAGWSGAFLARPGQVLDALTPAPAFVAFDILDLARSLLQKRTAAREKG